MNMKKKIRHFDFLYEDSKIITRNKINNLLPNMLYYFILFYITLNLGVIVLEKYVLIIIFHIHF